MSSGLQRAEVSSPASTVPGSTESANTPCPADGLAYALSTPPIISITDANTRILSHSFALPLHNPTVLDFRSSANRGACTPSAEERTRQVGSAPLRPLRDLSIDRYMPFRAQMKNVLASAGLGSRALAYLQLVSRTCRWLHLPGER